MKKISILLVQIFLPLLLFAQSISDYELKGFKKSFEQQKKAASGYQDFCMQVKTAHLLNSQEPDSAVQLYEQLLKLCSDWKLMEVSLRLKLDYAFQLVRNGDAITAQKILLETKDVVMAEKNKFNTFCYHRIQSQIWKLEGKLNEALEEALIAKRAIIEISESEKNEILQAIYKLSLVNIQSDIGNLYKDTQQLEKSIGMQKDNLILIQAWDNDFLEKVEKKENYKDLCLANAYNNLGSTLVSNLKETNKSDSLIEFYLSHAISLSEKINNLGFAAKASYNFSRYYGLIKNYKKQFELLSNALEINETINDNIGTIICKSELAENLIAQKRDPKQALALSRAAIEGVRQIEEFPSKAQIYRVFCSALAENRQVDSVLIYTDSVYFFNERELKLVFDERLTEMQTKYETAEKEKEIVVLNKDKQIQQKEISRQKVMRNAFIGGFALMLISASVFLVQRNRIAKEKARSEELLLNILPSETAEELKATGSAQAKSYDMVTVLFTDFKNFTQASEKLTAVELVKEINHCYSEFDKIIGKYGIEKIKTIGDSYMCAGGLPATKNSHPVDMIHAALDIRDFMKNYKSNFSSEHHNGAIGFEIRIGVHTGPVVAGIVGIKKFAYDIWGDTVNLASRMESSGEVGKVNISGTTYELVKDNFSCSYRGKVQAKNKGEIDMYFVEKLTTS